MGNVRVTALCGLLTSIPFAFSLAGCGSSGEPTYRVTGQVTYADGSNLKDGGKVIFFGIGPASPVQATGHFGPDGKFELTTFRSGNGVVAGEYEVSVVPHLPEDSGNVSPAEYAKAMQPIDDRYKNPKASGLRFAVSPDTTIHDFRIEVTRPQRR